MKNKRQEISGKFLKLYEKQQQTLRKSIKKRWQRYSKGNKNQTGRFQNFRLRFKSKFS